MKVFLILTPIFVLIGLWLLIYSRRRSRIIKAFGETKGFFYRYKDEGTLEQALNRAFALAAPLGRDFSRIRDIVEDDSIRLFRVTEALDLSHYGMPQNTHFGRIAVFFETEKNWELFFLAKNAQEIRHILPKDSHKMESDPIFAKLEQIIKENSPPHMLSVTVMRGNFIAYLEPMMTGSEKESDLNYLFELARMAKRTLNNV
jgi:hypothetical protein